MKRIAIALTAILFFAILTIYTDDPLPILLTQFAILALATIQKTAESNRKATS